MRTLSLLIASALLASCATDGQGDPADQPCSADLDADGDG